MPYKALYWNPSEDNVSMVVGRVNWKYLYFVQCFSPLTISKHQKISLSSATISLIARAGLSLADQFPPDFTLASYWLSRTGVMVLFTRESFEPGKCVVKISIEIPRAVALGLHCTNKTGKQFVNASGVNEIQQAWRKTKDYYWINISKHMREH